MYSDLDPFNSKHILDALHNLLKEINFKGFLQHKVGGRGPDPELLPYMSIFIDTEQEPDRWDSSCENPPLDFDSSDVKDLIEKIEDHNNKVKIANENMLEEKNKLLNVQNKYGPRISSSGPYTLPMFDALTKAQIRDQSWTKFDANDHLFLFFHNFKDSIYSDIYLYDKLIACKIYYESEDKTLLPDMFKNIWVN